MNLMTFGSDAMFAWHQILGHYVLGHCIYDAFRGYTLVLAARKAKVQHVLFCIVKWALGTFLKTGNRDQNISGTVLTTGCFLDLTLAVNTQETVTTY